MKKYKVKEVDGPRWLVVLVKSGELVATCDDKSWAYCVMLALNAADPA